MENTNIIKQVKNYLNPLKNETKYNKILYTYDIDHLKIIVKRPKKLTYLKLVVRANQKKYNSNNFTINHLDLNLKFSAYKLFARLALLANVLTFMNIKKLTLTPNETVMGCVEYKIYSDNIRYYLHKYCKDTYITINYSKNDIYFRREFWGYYRIADEYFYNLHFWTQNGIASSNYTIIDKTKLTHRSFKLKHRVIKHKK